MESKVLRTKPLPGFMSLSAGARKTRMTLQRFTRLARIANVDAYRIGNVIVIEDDSLKEIRDTLKNGSIRRGRPRKIQAQQR